MTAPRNRRNSVVLVAAFLTAFAAARPAPGQVGAKLSGTKHNLSSSGPGPVKVAGEPEMCKFCHTPHSARPVAPLWNRTDPGTYYRTYESSTLVATVGQPTGSSRLCLSCHDGTIALSQTYNSRNAPSGSIHISPQSSAYLGTDLSDDHPISFAYTSGLTARKRGLSDPSLLPKHLRLDNNKQLQCTTCHNPHSNKYGKFLTMSNVQSQMCQACHKIEKWSSSSHATSARPLSAARRDRWQNISASTVRQAACEGCHRPHSAGGRHRLLRHEAEENNCLSCHDGSVAAKNILPDLNKSSTHPVFKTTGVHDPAEDARTMRKHVECADCHNAHRASGGAATRAPVIKPSMRGVSGMSSGATLVPEATYEYQVCYKCHAGTGTVRSPLVDRVTINTNVADEFSPTNRSYHPVELRGKNLRVPSLVYPWKVTSQVYCTDCHGSSATGSAPRGLHGSAYRPLLVRNYAITDRTSESQTAYALCYGCHSRSNILADRSFKEHKKHIVDKKTPCSVCHDPHGISAARSSMSSGTHLINFDRRVVLPSKKTGRGPLFQDLGQGRGSCTLYCHGEDHNDQQYPDDD